MTFIKRARSSPCSGSFQGLVYKTGDKVSVVLEKDYSRAWRLVGLALDRVGFTVEDRNRSKGIYYVKYNDPDRSSQEGGFLNKLKFWSTKKPGAEELYQVTLNQEQELVRVVVNNDKGEADVSSTAERILKLLYEQLK